ncbi:MAG TPA: type I restriction endonuclease, partial [Candidatus Angelobacter sp.]|nr:type I restriction endonuclease [Candidatus Angelobacter sp.]
MPSEGKPDVPRLVLDLVERFERNRDSYKSASYNETQVRREFIDPFFKALGWDIDNNLGYAEAYKDVVHEDAIKVGEATKAPDYCFRIGGTRKFFLEAKRPSINIKEDASPAYQLRRYAWTTKLPLGILTDFEEFAVYDCRVKPDQKDKASVARILFRHYTEYATSWHEIAAIFSRDAVLKGSFDKYAEENKAKRGTAAVDDAFLETIESWRKDLAENLALRNRKLTSRELNFAVQRIIDRVIFLRICEGRGIEDYGKLRNLAEHDHIYKRLAGLFREADDRYNSGLFHFQPEKDRHEPPDQLTLALELDDKLLRKIIRGLYYPESPYVFSALPADVLGQVYEQFLGKVIRLTDAHYAKIDDKPEVKKAGGVYYTPTYIVDYIVQNTVGKLLEGRTPKQAAALRILDPACGSGSFLLGAYDCLLRWHLKYYTENEPAKWARGSRPALVQVSGDNWKLTIAERKRILLANIYGVDIDAQAVETTKLSLLLKVLEGETQQSLQAVFSFKERAL